MKLTPDTSFQEGAGVRPARFLVWEAVRGEDAGLDIKPLVGAFLYPVSVRAAQRQPCFVFEV